MDILRQYLHADRGRTTALASSLGITSAAISQWHRVPAERTLEVERLTGIPRHDLRPDLYPLEGVLRPVQSAGVALVSGTEKLRQQLQESLEAAETGDIPAILDRGLR